MKAKSTDSHPAAGQLILVIEADTPGASLSIRSAPLPPVVGLMLASRMACSPTPARLEPATRERLDHYPSMPCTGAMVNFLIDKPANRAWRYPAGAGVN
jgi:hypothetical protein